MTSTTTTTTTPQLTGERADLLEALGKHRYFLRHTVQGLTDEQARLSPTASELTLGGLVKHVAATEQMWARFAVGGADAFPSADMSDPAVAEAWGEEFRMLAHETLAGLLDHYAEVAAVTDELVRTLPSLDDGHPLPAAPWFEPGAVWSARRVLLHVLAETSQHAGHADVLRETIDGQKSMG